MNLAAHVENHAALFVEHGFRQTERRNIGPHQPAGLALLLEDGDFVAERPQIVRDRQRSRSRSDQRDALAVGLRGRLGQQMRNLALEIGSNALEPANRNRIRLEPSAPASRFARPVTSAPQDGRKNIRFPVHHVRFGVLALRDQADVMRNVRVRGTSPLAIHDTVEVIRVTDVGSFQSGCP